jgi:hypothetical protein
LPKRRRSWPIVLGFVGIVAIQVAVAVVSIDVLSAVRSFVTGESLYSKGQKDAQIYLLAYAENNQEEDYQRFLRALAIPQADRAAREALQLPEPDLERARQGLLGSQTHPDDIPGVIRLFLWFQKVPFMADPIRTWTEGDEVIEQMRVLVERAHERIAAGDSGAAAVSEMRRQAPLLNQRLTTLEREFAEQLGEGSRRTQQLLLGINLALAALLAATGLWFIRQSLRRQALVEDEVRRRQQSLQRLLDSTAEGLYGVDTHGHCTFINRAALVMLGYRHEAELLGREIHLLIQRPRTDTRTETRTGAVPPPEPGPPDGREHHVTGELFLRSDGTAFSVEYWSHPVLQDGEMQGAVVTFFDITERLRMQAALRQGELRLSKLVDAVADGVITTSADDKVVLFNRAAEKLFGVSAAEALGTPVGRFIARGGRHGAELAPYKRGAVHELTGQRADGTSFPLEATLSRLSTDQGPMTTVVLRDVSELHAARAERQAREALEATSRAKTEFLSRMSHELRTPLNAVLGFSQLLRLDAAGPPSAQQLDRIRHIERAGAHLLALVNDVLDLSRVDSGQMALTLASVDLASVVDESLAMVTTLANDAGIRLVRPDPISPPLGLDVPASLDEVRVMADRVRLRQVLVNLLSNAVKYNRAEGTVSVAWSAHPDACLLSVTDTGPGMAPEQLARLFEPFNRLGAERTQVEGTGIGLVLSRRLVELMHGELRIDSRVGEGTVATLVLERSDEQVEAPHASQPPSQHGYLDQGLHVLYAEDNEVNVELVRQVASFRPSVALRVAANGALALKMAREDPPDLMLVDMHLGDMTGFELARTLRDDPATADIRLVALSADALPEQIDGALAMGFEAYLTKPIEFRKLLRVLDGHLQS